jgi:TRAP-type C4-dicarboxylate transport system permease small subunit
MGTDTNEPGAQAQPVPQPGRATHLWNRGVDGLAAFGTVMIVILMAIIVADVLYRNIGGASLPLVAELGALTVVLIVFLQLGTAVRNDRLASTDFLVEALAARKPLAAKVLKAIWDLAGAAVCAGIAWASWSIFQQDMDHREFIGVTGVATMPTSPFRLLIFVGALVAAVQFLLMARSRFRAPAGKAGASE